MSASGPAEFPWPVQQGSTPSILFSTRSIGFDVLADPMAGSALKLAGVLAGLEQQLADRGMTGRELLAVCFDHRLGKVELVTRTRPLDADYPGLSTVLMQIVHTGVQDAIAVTQFRRIVFAEPGDVGAGGRVGGTAGLRLFDSVENQGSTK